MRILIYIGILAAVLVIPNRGTDVGKLIPVEVIAISETNGRITVRTDTEDVGEGNTVDEAIRDMKETSSGMIYMDTAEYLLLESGLKGMEQIERHLKRDVKVYGASEDIPLEGIANYLSVHESDIRLKNLREYGELPWVTEENERYRILEK